VHNLENNVKNRLLMLFKENLISFLLALKGSLNQILVLFGNQRPLLDLNYVIFLPKLRLELSRQSLKYNL